MLLIDTNISDNSEKGSFEVGDSYGVTARSLLVFALEASRTITDSLPILELRTGSRMGISLYLVTCQLLPFMTSES